MENKRVSSSKLLKIGLFGVLFGGLFGGLVVISTLFFEALISNWLVSVAVLLAVVIVIILVTRSNFL